MLTLPFSWYAWHTEESMLAEFWHSIRCVDVEHKPKNATKPKTPKIAAANVVATENKHEDLWQFKRKIAKRATKKGNSRVRYR